ncbi:hypothetical protein F4810DRAFT_321805 [Camillea tinctor]|nr:hypothetical protein F4810DRAFT_321805 [Camillea tinctor]
MKISIITFLASLTSIALSTPPPYATPRSTSTSTTFIISITTLPGPPPTSTTALAACPTVTLTTRPGGCSAIRCPIPTCTWEQALDVPCGCEVRTALYVDGCMTACPEGCATRVNTVTQLCEAEATATATAEVGE